MQKTRITRILHGLVMVAILTQLVLSTVMEMPKPGRASEDFVFEVHEVVGLASVAILALFWLWILVRRGETELGTLVPWFSSRRRQDLIADGAAQWASVRRLRVPEAADDAPLPSAVHGLGLLAATGMACSGLIVYLGLGPTGELSTMADLTLDAHEFLANLMWAFVIGHGAMAILHHHSGHPVLVHMFSLRT
ncbi:MAG: cytochrome b/b6 domain-containing protein [Rhodospirillales bacterium]|nr:cytochrome b/b6 domain-containing protein [Rhodospirillales bacterium]